MSANARVRPEGMERYERLVRKEERNKGRAGASDLSCFPWRGLAIWAPSTSSARRNFSVRSGILIRRAETDIGTPTPDARAAAKPRCPEKACSIKAAYRECRPAEERIGPINGKRLS